MREAREGDGQGIVDLFAHAFGRQMTLDEWRWKYLSNPTARIPATVVEEDGAIVGHYGLIPMRFHVFGETRLGVIPADVMVHESHRRGGASKGGAFREMYANARERTLRVADFGYGFPLPVYYVVAKRLFKDRDLLSFVPLHRRLTLRGAARRYLWNAGPLVTLVGEGSLLARRFGLALRRVGRRHKLSLRVIEQFGGETDELWEETKRSAAIQLSRDSDFLNWRYANAPGGRYLVLGGWRDGRMMGYVVLRRVVGDISMGYIVDLAAREDDPEVACSLMTGVEEILCRLHCDAASVWVLEHDPLSSVMTRVGFRPRGDPVKMLYQRINTAIDEAEFAHPESWRVCLGCSDGC